jgi:hypothetical protein
MEFIMGKRSKEASLLYSDAIVVHHLKSCQ